GGQQIGPADEDEVVVLGKVFEEQPQLAQIGQVHEVGVVEDGGQGLAGMVEAEGLFDEAALAFEGGAFELDAEGVAEDLDGVGRSCGRTWLLYLPRRQVRNCRGKATVVSSCRTSERQRHSE